MLQINTGKLFRRGVGRENILRGILYSNLRLSKDIITTEAGELIPTSTLGEARAIIFQMTERIEETDSGPGILVSHGIDSFLVDIAVIVSFYCSVLCTPSSDLLSRLLVNRRGLAARVKPSDILKRVYDDQVWCQPNDAEGLCEFISDLLALERRSYLGAMRAMRTFVAGLHRVSDDLDLAYTLLVASIEALAQGFDGHRSTWDDLEESKREALDSVLVGSDVEIANRVRAVILDFEHTALSRRFRDFTLSCLTSEYFRADAQAHVQPVGRADMSDAIQQAYRIRSRYIHSLEELPKPITRPGFHEGIPVDRVMTLTFQGLTRLARHVIIQFVQRQPKLEKEPYDYVLEQAGVDRVELVPRYWIARTENLELRHGVRRFEGFLDELAGCLLKQSDAALTDVREMLVAAGKLMGAASQKERRHFLALHVLFNSVVDEEQRSADADVVHSRYFHELKVPSVVALFFNVILGYEFQWDMDATLTLHREYFRRRGRKNGLRLHKAFEAVVTLEIAEKLRVSGRIDEAREFLAFAVENWPGNGAILALEANFEADKSLDHRKAIFP